MPSKVPAPDLWNAIDAPPHPVRPDSKPSPAGVTGADRAAFAWPAGLTKFIAEKSGLTEPTEAMSGVGLAAAATTVPVTVRVSGASAP